MSSIGYTYKDRLKEIHKKIEKKVKERQNLELREKSEIELQKLKIINDEIAELLAERLELSKKIG